MAGETPTDADLRSAVGHAEDAVTFVEELESSLALVQHDADRDVRASLRFTDAGVAESFT